MGNKKLYAIREGDFIFQITFAWEGAVAIAGEAEDGMYGSVRFPTFRVNEQICLPKYLLYYFRTEEGRTQLVKISPGSAGRNRVLSLRRISEVAIPLPPLEEQRRIVARVEALAEKIAAARQLRLEAVEEGSEILNALLHQKFSVLEDKYGVVTISDFAEVKGGKRMPRGERLLESPTAYPYIRVADMKNHTVLLENIKYVPEHIHHKISRYTISSDDVFVTIAGTIGYPGIVPDDIDGANLTENAAKIVFFDKKTIEKRYILFALRSPQVQKQFMDKRTTAAQPKLALHRIRSTVLPLPPLPEQRRIVAYLDELQAKVDALRALQAETQAELESLLHSVLERAFSGTL